MKESLRKRYVRWLLLAMGALIGLQLAAFAVYETSEIDSWKDKEHVREEIGEILVLVGVDALILPLVALIAWSISGRMLAPLHAVAETARRIRSGRLEERITATIPDDEMMELVRTVNDAFDKYQGVLRRLDQFTGDASHQLRTPLTALRTTGEVALHRERAPEEYREVIGGMLEEAARLEEIVGKLLLLARLEPEQMRARFAAVDAGALLATVKESFALQAQDRGVALEPSAVEGITLWGDFALLKQALSNLVDNALQYTPAGGVIRLGLRRVPQGGALLEVSDSGPGIPPACRDQLFQRFFRVPGTTTRGTGLGLAIVADIIKLHGGTIRYEDAPGGGACFRMELPGPGAGEGRWGDGEMG